MATSSLFRLPPMPGLDLPRPKRIDTGLPSGSIRGKRGGTIKADNPWPTEVPGWLRKQYSRMTLPEALFYIACQKLGWKYGEDFIYQAPFLETGSYERSPGSTVADFFCPATGRAGEPAIAVQVNGVFFHYTGPWADTLNDIDIASRLVALYGFDVIIVDDEDLLLNPLFYTKEAIESRRDYSRMKGKF